MLKLRPGLLVLVLIAVPGCSDDSTGTNANNLNGNGNDTVCGNGVIDPGEVCDGSELNGQTCEALGHDSGSLGCTAACQFDLGGCDSADCGNGILEVGEDCDGTDLGSVTCEGLGQGFSGGLLACTNCMFEDAGCFTCGDGTVEPAETCDDGNTAACDGCSSTCQIEICGNGTLECGELCDDGNTTPGDGCSSDCESDETCGNGYVDSAVGEGCDDGTANSDAPNAACRVDCQPQRCGDGILDDQHGEVCDDGNTSSGDSCSADCSSSETCGNGVVDSTLGEQCDDGNTSAGDGCGPTCLWEECGNAYQDPGEECDDGNTNSGDGCGPTCLFEACGNSVLDPGEGCDDGNTADCDGCHGDCSSYENGCGDGYVCGSEQCDDSNTNWGDGCGGTCIVESGWTCGGEPSVCTLGCTQPEALFLQAGCQTSEMCTMTAFSGGSYVCVAEGSDPYYGSCTNYQTCVAGAACINIGAGDMCLPYCDINDPTWTCPNNGSDHAACMFYYPQGQTISGLCVLNECDAVAQTSCGTDWCNFAINGVARCNFWDPPGAVGLHAACVQGSTVPSERCLPNMRCMNTGTDECLQMCRLGQSDCTVPGESCVTWNPPDPVYGVCQ